MTEVQCQYCGELFDERGLGAHQRHCDSATEAEVTPDDESLTGLAAEVRDRDDGRCLRCGADSSLRVHEVDPDVGHQRANLITLCDSCEAGLEGLHPRTKRTKVHTQ